MISFRKKNSTNLSMRLTMALTVVFTVLVVFSFKYHPNKPKFHSDGPKTTGSFIVMFDVGHGGIDDGSVNYDYDAKEKDILLGLTYELSKYNSKDVKYFFTRESDKTLSLSERVKMSNKVNADLFISLHINTHVNPAVSGIEVFYSEKNIRARQSKDYCKIFAEKLSLAEKKKGRIKSGNFAVLKDNECPAVLLNLGFISNGKDLEFLAFHPEKLAKQISEVISDIMQ